MSPSELDYLRHILDETDYLTRHAHQLSKDQFLKDETLRRAFVRSLEIVGEATKKLPGSLRQTYPNIEWRAIAGMRDRLIHDYLGVDYELVWDVVRNEIPVLQAEIKHILRDLEESQ